VRVQVDRERCVGSGQCALSVPEVFDQGDDDGIVVLLDQSPPAGLHSAVRRAEEICPAKAIHTTE
jgi:ferredoxin